MKKHMNKIFKNITTLSSLAAFAMALSSTGRSCAWIFHEPEMPNEVKNYKKVN